MDKKELIFGFGINDANYVVRPTINGKQVACSFYRTWFNMLYRCYSVKFQDKNLTYIGCTVTAEWHSFSNFKSWMETQDWQGRHLDKDLLVVGNKVYSPSTCVFISQITNSFTTDSAAARGQWPIGVSFSKVRFQARCRNPFTEKEEYLGFFHCPNQAHQAWRKRKHELACQLADMQSDPRVAEALRVRYK